MLEDVVYFTRYLNIFYAEVIAKIQCLILQGILFSRKKTTMNIAILYVVIFGKFL